jgi:hypothetical protein
MTGQFRSRSALIVVAVSASLFAQIVGSADWKTKNDRGNRYEGSGGSIKQSNAFALLSFTAFLQQPLPLNSQLRVRFFLPEPLPVVVQAREIEERSLYWMESKPGAAPWHAKDWNEFRPWNTADVIDRAHVPADNLGVAVYLTNRLPCSVCSVAPAWVGDSNSIRTVDRYLLRVRTNAPMDIVYQVFAISGDRELKIFSDSLGQREGGLPVDLPVYAGSLPEGQARIVVTGVLTSDRKAKAVLEVNFFHKKP